MSDLTAITDEELDNLQFDVNAEMQRRNDLRTIPNQIATMNVAYLDAAGTVEGEAWVQPTGAHDAYPLDWIVTHNEKAWVSLVAANVWEPGVSGWREETGPGNEWPAWIQPTGASDSYAFGDKVTHLELYWISDLGDNVWEPGVYGWTETPGE